MRTFHLLWAVTMSGVLAATIFPTVAMAQANAGNIAADTSLPFEIKPVATFDQPWAIAFLPDGRLLVTEKGGRLFVATQNGGKREISGVPEVQYGGQNGLLDVAVSPNYEDDKLVYITFVEPGNGGSGLALARARLSEDASSTRLSNLNVIWRQTPKGAGSQPGGIIAFAPDGRYLFLTSGDRRRPQTPQDPDIALGKVLRLNLDGSTPDDNPMSAEGGVRAQIWTSGHRNPYGLAFAPDGELWLHEMGPSGGDELNHIVSGRNYGWPVVSNGDNYDGSDIPDHQTRPEFQPPAIYWSPVIAPAGLSFYAGNMFPQWNGSALIGLLSGTGLIRVEFDSKSNAIQANRWDLGQRIRDVAVARDGAIWIIEDDTQGGLLRLVPKS